MFSITKTGIRTMAQAVSKFTTDPDIRRCAEIVIRATKKAGNVSPVIASDEYLKVRMNWTPGMAG